MFGIKLLFKHRILLLLLNLSPYFDRQWYREHANISLNTNAVAHYLDGGWQTCDPSVRFRQDLYLEANPDVKEAGICPLAHYLLDGRRQKRLLYPGMIIENHYHRYAFPRAVKRRFFELMHFRKIARNRSTRLLVIVHIYYEESIEEILEYLKNLRPYSYDLVVTTTENKNTDMIRQAVLHFKKDAEIRVVPNRGFDIWPYLETLGNRNLKKYDLVFKLQSKRHFPREGALAEDTLFRGRDWFVMLFRSVLGARWIHLNIDRLMHDPRISLIAARNLLWRDPLRKERIARKRLAPYGLSLPEHYSFVAGSCFAIKASRISPVPIESLSSESFGTPVRGGFTLAHAFERYISGSVPGAEQFGNPVCRFRLWMDRRMLKKRQRETSIRIQELRKEEPALFDPSFTSGSSKKPLTIVFAVTETGSNAVAGDLFTAKEMAASLEKLGARCFFVSQWEPDGMWYHLSPEVDILISMLQHYDPQNIRNASPDLLIVGWARNWFDAWADHPDIDEYDLLLASSPTACAKMKDLLNHPVPLLPIATNPERFHLPEEDSSEYVDEEITEKFSCDYCFNGNRFGTPREIEEELDPATLPWKLNLYGSGWDTVERFAPWYRGHLPYDEMPLAYRYTRIVLDDATPSTKEAGAINSRVYDAIAAGCLVLTNNEVGAGETFKGLLPVFNSKESLKELLELYLGNEKLRQEKVQELRQFVLENHTYDTRAKQLLAILQQAQKQGKAAH